MFQRKYKDQFTLRLDEDVMKICKSISKETNQSLQSLFNTAILHWLEDHGMETVKEQPAGAATRRKREPMVVQDPFFPSPTTFFNLD